MGFLGLPREALVTIAGDCRSAPRIRYCLRSASSTSLRRWPRCCGA